MDKLKKIALIAVIMFSISFGILFIYSVGININSIVVVFNMIVWIMLARMKFEEIRDESFIEQVMKEDKIKLEKERQMKYEYEQEMIYELQAMGFDFEEAIKLIYNGEFINDRMHCKLVRNEINVELLSTDK